MRIFFCLIALACLFTSCDNSRVYEENVDFDSRNWLVSEIPSFEFEVPDSTQLYNLYINLRTEVAYPNANIYVTYYLNDSTGKVLQKKLISEFLFDKKTGKPFGKSGIGDVYDNQFPVLKDYTFQYAGKFEFKVEQFMRMDTLPGVLSVGMRLERAGKN